MIVEPPVVQSDERAAVVWLTGLPCSGKSTIALHVADAVRHRGRVAHVFDGDVLRRSTSADLGFSVDDRCEQAARVARAAAGALDEGAVPIVALVSPLRRARAAAQAALGAAFLEVHVDAPLAICETRDVKGMYARARRHELEQFTGISSRYEPPAAPALRLVTSEEQPAESAERVVALLVAHGALPGSMPSVRRRRSRASLSRS